MNKKTYQELDYNLHQELSSYVTENLYYDMIGYFDINPHTLNSDLNKDLFQELFFEIDDEIINEIK